jgi:hypothetical protein
MAQTSALCVLNHSENFKTGPGAEANACHPSYPGGRDLESSLGKKVSQTSSQPIKI